MVNRLDIQSYFSSNETQKNILNMIKPCFGKIMATCIDMNKVFYFQQFGQEICELELSKFQAKLT